MFPELNTLLNINYRNPAKGHFILITEDRNDASFLVHHFLNFYLKGGHKVCFLALSQSFTHYSSVSQKLGVNLSSCLENNNLVFIEALKYTIQAFQGEDVQVDNPFVGIDNQDFSLRQLYDKIRAELSKFDDGQPFLLLIDDISVLLSLGVSLGNLQMFVHYLQSCLTTSERHGCLVLLTHTDSDKDDLDEEIFRKHMVYKCDTELHIKALSSGYCREVHGQLDIVNYDEAKISGYPTIETVQYKILDKSVKFFAPGTSSSVL